MTQLGQLSPPGELPVHRQIELLDQQAVLATSEPELDAADQGYRPNENALAKEKTTTKANGVRQRGGSVTGVSWKRLLRFGYRSRNLQPLVPHPRLTPNMERKKSQAEDDKGEPHWAAPALYPPKRVHDLAIRFLPEGIHLGQPASTCRIDSTLARGLWTASKHTSWHHR